MVITDEEILEKTFVKPEHLSQYHACLCCKFFKRGFAHSFLKGNSVRCELLHYMEEYPDDLAMQKIWCRGPEPIHEECERCEVFKVRGTTHYACSLCSASKQTCLLCPNLIDVQKRICSVVGNIDEIIDDLIKEYAFGFSSLRLAPFTCKNYGKWKKLPKKCDECYDLEDCPFSYNIEECDNAENEI